MEYVKYLYRKNIIPYLPFKINNKLLFTNCYTCGLTYNLDKCIHSIEERMLTGTYPINEIHFAVKHCNYRIIKIHEILLFEIDSDAQPIFRPFIDHFFSLKVYSTNYENTIKTDEELQIFIDNFYDVHGIKLDKNRFRPDNSYRKISKAILNSFWGKFSECERNSYNLIVKSREEFYNFINNPLYDIASIYLSDQNAWISYKYKITDVEKRTSIFLPPNKNSSFLVGSLTTSYSRTHLYKQLASFADLFDQTGHLDVLYCDTDSIFYLKRPNAPISYPETGLNIGDLTDEIKDKYGDEAFISEFVSIAPKSYGLIIHRSKNDLNPIHVIKCKGLCLSSESSKHITIDTFRALLHGELINENGEFDDKVLLKKFKIQAQKYGKVYSYTEEKKMGFTYTKRIVLPDFTTRPFGYRENDDDED